MPIMSHCPVILSPLKIREVLQFWDPWKKIKNIGLLDNVMEGFILNVMRKSHIS